MRKWSGLELFPVVSPTLINNRPIRTVRDLADHVILHGDDGREWHTWLAAADGLDLERGRRHHHERRAPVDRGRGAWPWRGARRFTSPPAALLARGQLVAPFNLSVPAVDDFYVACRNEMQLGADRARCSSTGCSPRRSRPTAAPTRRWPAASASAGSARRCAWSAPRPRPEAGRSGVLFVGPAGKAGGAFENSMLIGFWPGMSGKVRSGFGNVR